MNSTPLAEFRSNKAVLVLLAVVAVVLGALGALWIGVVWGQPWDSTRWISSLLGSAAFIASGFLFVTVFICWGQRVVVHDAGITILRGGTPEEIPWGDIAAVLQGGQSFYLGDVLLLSTHSFVVRRRNGRARSFNDLWERVTVLGDILHDRTSASLAAVYVDAYNQGKSIGFGAIGMSQQGLIYGDRVLPWAELGEITSDPFGNLVVAQRGGGLMNNWFPWCKIPGSAIENPRLFTLLVHQVLRPQ